MTPPRSPLSARERRLRWMAAQQSALRGYTRLPSVHRILGWVGPGILLAAWLIAALLRLLVQDRSLELAYYYYATPPAVLTLLALAAAAWWLVARRWRRALLPLVLALGSGLWTYRTAWYRHEPAARAADGVRVLFWNVAHGTCGWPRIADRIRRYDADLVALTEGVDEQSDMAAVWQQLLPDYNAYLFDSGITLLGRIDVTPGESGVLGGDNLMAFGWYVRCEVATPEGPFQLVLVDVQGTTKRSRYHPLSELERRLEPLAGQPVLLVGDLNTPTDSVFLKPLRQTYRNAFESAGRGYAATWPVPVPLLTLDQAWFNAGLQVRRCELDGTWVSDHRAVVVDITVRR